MKGHRPKRPARSLQQALLNARRAGWGDWIRGPADEHAVAAGCYFDLAAAERVRGFFRDLLVHSKGKFAGRPFELLDWQYGQVLGPLFGWRRADGSRRFRTAYVEIPKKNGKSTLASGVSLYMLAGDGEAGAEVYACATDRDQAGIVYGEAANMVEASPDLLSELKVLRATLRIIYPETNSWFEALAADAASSEGKNAHAVICDELHAWQGRAFFESLLYSGAAREQPLFFVITTAGDDLTSVCYEEHERAQRILKGDELADECFAYIAAAGPGDDWKQPATWAKANPSLGVTLKADEFEERVREAVGSPTKENAFKRYRLGLWIGASEAWLSMDAWQACGQAFDEAELHGLPAWPGIDLSRTRDLSAVVWVVPCEGLYYLVPRLYIPADLVAKKEREDKVPYRSWIQAGLLRTTPGDVIDYAVIRRDVQLDAERFSFQEGRYDPHNAEHLCNQQLRLEDGLEFVSMAQSMQNMGPAATAFEAFLKQRRIRHGGHKVLEWMAGGCVVYEDSNGNIRPVKRRSRSRIDGIIASLMGLSAALANEAAGGSFYDEHEVELI